MYNPMDYQDDATAPEKVSAEEATRVVTEAFFDRLRRVDLMSAPEAREAAVRSTWAGLQGRVDDLIANDLDRANVGFTLLAVAAYEVLAPEMGHAGAVRVVDECLNQPLREWTFQGTRAMLDGAPDPFAALVAVSKQREEHFFGPSFAFERPVDDGWGYVLQVRRCLFHEVLAAVGRKELQPILCHFDMNWADAIEPKRHHFRFVRPSTFATDTLCRMWFMREEPPLLPEGALLRKEAARP
jgi:hypothetical protein